jgi:uncharacterized protein
LTVFVDTNVFIRLLAQDDPDKSRQCLKLFKQADSGAVQLFTSESVIAEVVYVLSSRALYGLPREEIVRLVQPLVEIRGLQIEHKLSVLRALELYAGTNLDFEDCLSVQHVRRAHLDGIYSYDHGFDRVAGLVRLEP